MDPISFVASFVSLVELAEKLYKQLELLSHKNLQNEAEGITLKHAETLLRLVSHDFNRESFFQELPHGILGEAYQKAYLDTCQKLELVVLALNALGTGDESSTKKAIMVLGGRRFDAYARATHELEKSVNRLREIDQLARLQRVESRLNKFDKMLRIMGTVSEEGLKDILENLKAVKESGSTQESYERQNNLEEVQKELHSMLGPSKGRSFTLDPLCFPFVIPSRTPNVGSNVVAQLKLDTGAVDNWIRTSILEKANIDYERMEYTKTFIGAGGAQFSPLGQVKITWCSENQALTRESLFLVHDQLPFDVILGFDYIVGSLSELSEPVLPLRHRLSKDDYQELQNSQLRKRASNQQIINLQKAQDAKEREEKRLLKAATRAATAAPSVLGTSAHGSLFPPGTPVYGTSSRSSSVFNIPATMPVISEPEQSSVNPSSIATSQQDGESFTTASSSVTQYQPSYVQPHVSDGEDEVEK